MDAERTDDAHGVGQAVRATTAGGQRAIVLRFGGLDGTLYVPRTRFDEDEAPIYCRAAGDRVYSLRHKGYPDLLTPLSTEAGALDAIVEGDCPAHRLGGAALSAIATTTHAVLFCGDLRHGRRWMVRDWDADTPELFRVFGESFPTVEPADLPRLLSCRLMASREQGGGNAGQEELAIAVSQYRGRDCLVLRDTAPRPGEGPLGRLAFEGARWESAHPGDVMRLVQEGMAIVIQGELWVGDPYGVWLVIPPGSPRELVAPVTDA